MPKTSRGTEYTVHEFTPPDGSISQWVAPTQAVEDGIPVNMLVYCHGSAGEHNDMLVMPTWKLFRDRLLDNGWGWVECLAYDPSWGTAINNYGSPTGVAHYRAALAVAKADLNVSRIAVMGRSMGGMPAMRLFLNEGGHVGADTLIQVSAVQNFTDWVMPAGKAQFRIPYGYPTDQAFVDDLPNIDPSRYPLSAWEGKRVLQVVGDVDVSVPAVEHGLWLRRRIHHTLGVSGLSVDHGGGHSSPVGPQRADDMMRFLQDFGGKQPGGSVQAIRAGFHGESREVIEVAVHVGGRRRPVEALTGTPA